MSADYLLKTEPSEYSFQDLERDGATVWDGVSNPTAVKNLREMTAGARLVIYETGDRRSAVGTAVVVSVALTIYMRVRRQMKRSAARKANPDGLDHSSPEV